MTSNEKSAVRATYFSIFSNILMAAIKWIAGTLGHSYAMIADAIESTTDIFASILVLLGIKYASKPADKKHPYGHGRIEPLITFLVVGFLISSACIIATEAIHNMRIPDGRVPESWTLYVLGAIIIWKEISYQYVMKKARQTHSSSLKADAWHHRSDAITSIAAFVGISIALYTGYEPADDWAALIAAGFILFNCYKIFRPALGEIMDENQYDEMMNSIREIGQNVDGVIDIEKCLIRKAGMKYFVDLHAMVDAHISVKEGHDVAVELKYTLKKMMPEIENVLVHVEPNECLIKH